MTTRRALLTGSAALLAAGTAARSDPAWPSRPVTVIVPLQAGSAADVAVRLFTERLGEALGTRLTVENLAGAAGALGAARAAAATPDGYGLAALNGTILTVLPNARRGQALAYEPFSSFVPISGVATIPTFLGLHRDVPAATVPEFLALLRAKPEAFLFGSGGNGSPQHLAAEMFMAMTGARMRHVPYRGATAAATDLAGGHVHAMFVAHTLALPFLPTGQIRYVGFCGTERHPDFPDVPTVAEQGVAEFDYSGWTGLFAVRGTPEPIVARLREAGAALAARPDFGERLVRSGLGAWPRDHGGVTEAMRRDDARWKGVLARAYIAL